MQTIEKLLQDSKTLRKIELNLKNEQHSPRLDAKPFQTPILFSPPQISPRVPIIDQDHTPARFSRSQIWRAQEKRLGNLTFQHNRNGGMVAKEEHYCY